MIHGTNLEIIKNVNFLIYMKVRLEVIYPKITVLNTRYITFKISARNVSTKLCYYKLIKIKITQIFF